MKRFKEIVEPHGVLLIYSEKSVWDHEKIEEVIGQK